MSSPLAVVVREGGRARLYGSRWGGQGLDSALFHGPEHALRRLRDGRALDLSAGWTGRRVEGAALIDCDRSELLWFGGEDVCWDVWLRAAQLELMAPHWPGWAIQWAHGGTPDIAAALGAPEQPQAWRDGDDAFFFHPEHGLDGDMLVTWRAEGGPTQARRMNASVGALWAGPSATREALGAYAGLRPFKEDDDGWLASGADIDFGARRLAFWSAKPTPHAEFNARKAWRGWEIEWLRDNVDAHLKRAPAWVPRPVVDHAQLRRTILRWRRSDQERMGGLRGE